MKKTAFCVFEHNNKKLIFMGHKWSILRSITKRSFFYWKLHVHDFYCCFFDQSSWNLNEIMIISPSIWLHQVPKDSSKPLDMVYQCLRPVNYVYSMLSFISWYSLGTPMLNAASTISPINKKKSIGLKSLESRLSEFNNVSMMW